MEAFSFKCSINGCEVTVKYNDALDHIKICQIPVVTCLAKCSDTTTFKGRQPMRDHFKKECEKTTMQCDDCAAKLLRCEMKQHDCLPGLIEKIKNLEI